MLSLRLLTTTGQAVERSFAPTTTLAQVKQALLDDWPTDFVPRSTSGTDLKLIFSGKVLENDSVPLSSLGATTDKLTVHVLLKKKSSHQSANANANSTEADEVTSIGSAQNDSNSPMMREEDMFHFHGCSISQEEVEQMNYVFERKSVDNKLPFDRVHSFLVRFLNWIEFYKVLKILM